MVDGAPAARRRCDLLRREPVAAPVVTERPAGRLGLAPLGVQLLTGAEAAVGLSLGEQPLGVGLVPRAVRALEVAAPRPR